MSESASQELSIGEKFKEFLRNFRDASGLKYMDRIHRMINLDMSSLLVDYPDLYRYSPEVAEALVDSPAKVLKEFDDALKDVVTSEDPDYAKRKGRFHVRVQGLYESTKIRDIKTAHMGKLVQVEGIITRMRPVRSRMVRAMFRHEKEGCNAEFLWPDSEDEQLEDKIEKPPVCPVCHESGGRFVLLRDKSIYIDWQELTLQERPEDVPGGQMPRSIAVELTEDLVDIARPGDLVTVVGIVEPSPVGSEKTPLFELRIKANSIRVSEKVLEEVAITREDEEKILELAKDPWIRERIIASIAPSIYGHWDLKEAIALQLFGGVQKVMPDGTRVRGDIHVLFIGDPGVAKSQLLQSASRIAPRSVFTSGKGSTAAGLTAAVLKDPKTSEYFLEAGALVLADGGLAVIDEFDKMRPEDRVSIHEAMEQQTVSISKAGIVARLNARAAVLAAGNPKYGLYDPQRPFVDNVNLPPTVLSRFDLIFVVRDLISKEHDERLAQYILDVHSDVSKFAPEIDPQLLKKYIIYAKRYHRPRLSDEAKEIIKDFFVAMRSTALKYGSEGQIPVPVTARQLEALVRLSEAHARMKLKDVVEAEDAEEAIRLVLSFLSSVGIDIESGVIDYGIISTGASFHARRLMTVITDTVRRLSEDGRPCVKHDDLVKEVVEATKVSKEKVEEAINKMKQQGLLIEHRTECYKVM
ncbi:MAG: minichromosome maintenance protein MCM [Acidilobus sp.]